MKSRKICLTCNSKSRNLVARNTKKSPRWVINAKLTHAGPEKVPSKSSPKGSTVKLVFRLPKDSFWKSKIVWWAATPRSLCDAWKKPNVPDIAYQAKRGWPNKGLLQKKNGKGYLKCMCPQPYREGNVLWPRHIHFFRVDDKNQILTDEVRTIGAWPGTGDDRSLTHIHGKPIRNCCFVTPQDVSKVFRSRNGKKYFLLNALGNHEQLFPNMNESRQLSCRYNEKRKLKSIQKKIGVHPVIVFCRNKTCNAASKLINNLEVSNIFYMPAGIDGFFESSH